MDKPDGGRERPEMLDLRSGRTVWELMPGAASPTIRIERPIRTDVLIVGAGITGSFLAERLTREGREVLVVDRHEPRTASTAASTALLQWEIDAPLLALEDRFGFDAAAAVYQRSLQAVDGIAGLVGGLGASPLQRRDTLYFSGNRLDPQLLGEEMRLRRAAGLPGRLVDRDALTALFGFDRAAAILSPGSAEANPVALARLAMDAAIARGARIASPVTIVDYALGFEQASAMTSEGIEIAANVLVLANGYEMPRFVPGSVHRIRSTYALATVPQPEALWPGHALLWEAAEPYFYARTTPEGRIIFGGEDDDTVDADQRDAALPVKAALLKRRLGALLPTARLDSDAVWAGFFGETADGLPLIGAVPGAPRCLAAFGYGGNGITFSLMASDIIATELAGRRDPTADLFAIDR